MHFDLQRILRVNHFSHDKHTALQAKQEAQRIAFGPFIFQAAKAMRDLGVLSAVEAAGDEGLALDAIEARTGLSRYAARVLAEAGLGIGALGFRLGAGALGKKLGLEVVSAKDDARGRVYRIVQPA